MEKVTLKVNVLATESGCRFVSAINGNRLADVRKSKSMAGRYIGDIGNNRIVVHSSYSDAYQYVANTLKYRFGYIGIDVEFINVEG